jgi:polyisoprenoid-binding protein YceI
LQQMTNMMASDPEKVIAVRYLIDSAASKFSVQAFAGGLLSAFGHNPVITIPSFTGEVQLTEQVEQSSFIMTIAAGSLRVASDVSEKDRLEIERMMHERVLESVEYPEILYTCSKVSASKTGEGQYWAASNGDLTLHGTTRSLNIPARVSLTGESLRAIGNFTLLQSDFGIELVSVAGGSLKVKDELKFSFDVVARKQG